MSIKKFKSKETVKGIIHLKDAEGIQTLIPITLLILENVGVNKYECKIIEPNSMVTNLIRDNYFEKSAKNYLFTELELNKIVSLHSGILFKKNNEIEKSCISNEEDKKKTSSSEKCQARWSVKIGSFTVRQEGVNRPMFTCPNTSVCQSKYWNQRMVCDSCHAFGHSVYGMKLVLMVLNRLMKEPAKAKAVRKKITNLYLKIAGTNYNKRKVTKYMKEIVDSYYPGKNYLERAWRMIKNSNKKSNTSHKNGDTFGSESYLRPKVSKPTRKISNRQEKTKVSVTPSIKPKKKDGNNKSNSKFDNMVSLQKKVNFDHNLFHKGYITVDKKKSINCYSKFKNNKEIEFQRSRFIGKKLSDEEMRKLGFNDYINYMTVRYDESIGSSVHKSRECKFLTHPFNRTERGSIQRCWKCKLVMNGEGKIENKKFAFWRNEINPARYHYL